MLEPSDDQSRAPVLLLVVRAWSAGPESVPHVPPEEDGRGDDGEDRGYC